MEDLSNYRKSYEKSELVEGMLPENPMALFEQWFHEVRDSQSEAEANAMTVSTFGLDGFPKARVVLLKKYDAEGFKFYTNYNSEKGKAIAQNPNLCLSFFWQNVERQVIIKGKAQKTSETDSDEYFNSRPTGSKLGAIVSNQSEPIANRSILEDKLRMLEQEYDSKEIQRPEYWGGYRVRPVSIEFWQGRPNRLHDRILYTLQPDSRWSNNRLAP